MNNTKTRGESHIMAESQKDEDMTPEAKTKMKKLAQLRDALWGIGKTLGATAAYVTVLFVIVKFFYDMVEAEKIYVDYAMVMAVVCTAAFHAFIGLSYITTD